MRLQQHDGVEVASCQLTAADSRTTARRSAFARLKLSALYLHCIQLSVDMQLLSAEMLEP
jgi:hypothetical protein